ncbi:alpha-methylacyl-CoA racemase [Paecilomyces variotii No. 5]|uniref:Alpha-methylacyl-CoA racemase n=1 Tax=Byssochlamys spectabilis (strain No. 5 / NBRC 109023) TaxID=1356009 RepID=V5G7P7_BYSSN|nr:alpha-methylacyl-CoA racemase [Paecilomyces variotii No. 5]
MASPAGPLAGTRVVELAGLAPGPFSGLLLADYGASVLRVDRSESASGASPSADLLTRHKKSIILDLKDPDSKEVLLSLISEADVLIDPYRPGVLERLGLSPSEVLLKRNPRLIVARMTGFRRTGKYSTMAGHDINYLAVSGVLSMLGPANSAPYPPINLLGDFAGGGSMCFLGILLALISRSRTGKGQIVEANMVDGSAYVATMPRLSRHLPAWDGPRGENLLDGGCPFYTSYETKDKGKYFAVGALEPKFYKDLIKGLGLDPKAIPSRNNPGNWPALRSVFEKRFKEKTRSEWEAIFDGTDACATPILEQDELQQRGHEQGLAVDLSDTPGIPIKSDDGGWEGHVLEAGKGGQETLQEWMRWKKGKDFNVKDDGTVIRSTGAKL